MRKRRTKLARSPLSRVKPNLAKIPKTLPEHKKRTYWNLRNKPDFNQWLGWQKSKYLMPGLAIWKYLKKQPEFHNGLPYYAVEKLPELYKGEAVAPFHGVYLVKVPSKKIVKSRKKRQAFLEAMLDHEAREEILGRAGYTRKVSHSIAARKEKRDLERKGLLEDYLNWLKKEHPIAYRNRIKEWKIQEKTSKLKD